VLGTDGNEQIQNIREPANVAAGAILDPCEAIVRGVGVEVEALGGGLDIEVGSDLLQ
jgi:hypothetical protein